MQEFRSKTKELLEKLKAGIKEVKSSEEFKQFLKALSLFHTYSFFNSMLISLQRSEAMRVAGFKTWEKLGRRVKKGEHGIAIFAPCKLRKRKPDEEDEEDWIVYFRVVFVFDISQTEGSPLPELPRNKIENTHETLLPALLKFCKQRDIKVSFEELEKYEGLSLMGSIVISKDKNPTEQAVILVHEIAHELIHATSETRHQLTREQKEMEAESVAFVVSNFLSIPETNSEEYLALYHKSYDLMESMAIIYTTAQEIMQAVNPVEQSKKGEEDEASLQVVQQTN